MEKISVIIAVYNTETYLRECLESVINQSYSHLEIIIVDDHSSDASQTIINEYARQDSRIKSYRNEKTLGVAASRNVGLHQVTGEFVYFLDSDDFLDQHTLKILLTYGKEYDVVAGRNLGVDKAKEQDEERVVDFDDLHMILYKRKRTKLFKNRSILNKLIRTQLINAEKLSFNEEVRHFSDFSLIAGLISSVQEMVRCKEAIYYKRKRPNPIDAPALMQEDMLSKIKSLTSIIKAEKEKTHLSIKALAYLDNQFLQYYRRSIVRYFYHSAVIDEAYPHLVDAVLTLEDNAMKNKDLVLKREIRSINDGNLNKYKKTMRQHNRLRALKNGLRSKQRFYTYLYNHFFIKANVDNQLVVFESFLGKSYSDSPKYIYQHMVEQGYDYKYIWIFNEPGKELPGNAKQVKRFSLKHYYYLAKAKYWVSNARAPLRFRKRPENTYLQTWHGTPLKKLGIDIEDVKMPGTTTGRYKVNFTRETARWDYLVSPNQYSSDIFKQAFKFENTFLESGYPRNDVLYKNNHPDYIESLKTKLDLPIDKKVILYAPTWRDDEFLKKGEYKFDIKLNLARMQEELSDDYIIVLRMHYLIANELDISSYKGFVYDLSTYNDISELYLVSDILITDYSSVFFDYANLKRPILFYTYDLEKYRDTLRGFYIDIENEVPGPLLYRTHEVITSIKEIDRVTETYADKYETFYNRFCEWENGDAAKQVVDRVFND